MTSPELARLLERHRDEINAAYRGQAALRAPERIEGFLSSFRSLAEAAAGSISRNPGLGEAAGPSVVALFRVWLDAWSKAPAASERALASMIESFPGPLAQDPEKFLRSSLNAMETLAGHSEDSLERWQGAMSRLAGTATGLDEYLRAGLAAAWLSGLAQYREAAVRELAALPSKTVAALFGLEAKGPGLDPGAMSRELADDPWADPAETAGGRKRERACLAAAGSWAGYGGQFSATPVLWSDGQGVVAGDGTGSFRVYADRWGAALVGEPGFEPGKAGVSQAPGFKLGGNGLGFDNRTFPWDEIEVIGADRAQLMRADLPVSSSLARGNSLFFTHPLSFRIYILGLPGGRSGSDTN